MHDLVRLYAREQLSQQAAADAFERALGLHRFTTDRAWKRFVNNTGVPGDPAFPTRRAALEWFQDERLGLIDTVTRSDTVHARERVLLAADLAPFLQRAHRIDDDVHVTEAAVRLAEAALRLSDDAHVPDLVRGVAYGNLGMAMIAAERLDEAIPALDRAAALMQSAPGTLTAPPSRG